MAQKYVKPAAKQQAASNEPVNLLYDKSNYRILAISVLIVAIGFVLMSGTTDIYNSTKIVIAPIVVLAGFALGFWAILKKPESKA